MALVTSAAASLKNTWGFSPQSIPGLQLWLDGADTTSMVFSSGSNVSLWRDKSGLGNNGTPTTYFGGSATTVALAQNSIGGLPAIQFTGVSSIVGNIVLTGTGYTAFCVFNMPTQPTTAQNPRLFCITRPGVSDGNGGDVGGLSFNGTLSKLGFVRFNSSVTSFATVTIPFNAGVLASSWSDPNFAFMASNGSTSPVVSSPSVTLGSLNTSVYSVGAQIINDSTSPFTGFIGELLIFNNTLSTTQRQQIEGYLATKWGLKANLPATHPYSAATRVPFNRPFFPTDIAGCQLWLDAADRSSMILSGTGGVTRWNDKSGAGFNMTGFVGLGGSTIPSYSVATGSSPAGVVLCSRGTTNKNFFGPSNWNAALTISTATHCLIAVHNPTSTTVSPGNSSLFRFQGTANTAVTAIVFPQLAGSTPRGYTNNQGASPSLDFNNSTLVENSTAGVLNLIVANIAATTQFVYKNGNQQSSATSTITNRTSDNLSIGCQNWTNINGEQYDFYSGTIHEMLVFNTTLTTPQRQQIEQYLAWKWDMTTNLPTAHPGKLLPAFGTVAAPPAVSFLVVGGGGGGGSRFGGGGGGGGFLTGTLAVWVSTSYTITVGTGGTGGAGSGGVGNGGASTGGQGNSSVFSTITAVGGGGGGAGDTGNGANGASGGGASGRKNGMAGNFYPSPAATGGTGTSGQGNSGSDAIVSSFVGGGGGGAGAAAVLSLSGAIGRVSSITGTPVTYAGGGGGGGSADPGGPGGTQNGAAGGAGGGGGGGGWSGTSVNPSAGTANTGGGGGGGAFNLQFTSFNQPGANGGSGVVILAYPSTYNGLLSFIDASLTFTQNFTETNIVYRFTAGTGNVRW